MHLPELFLSSSSHRWISPSIAARHKSLNNEAPLRLFCIIIYKSRFLAMWLIQLLLSLVRLMSVTCVCVCYISEDRCQWICTKHQKYTNINNSYTIQSLEGINKAYYQAIQEHHHQTRSTCIPLNMLINSPIRTDKIKLLIMRYNITALHDNGDMM